ncbi:MAG TPA: hypothetical protein VJ254_00810 [Streptosporangiaceae bacterium]|nr:hypothetical protein [Streptosporangiaceae bacterium]
MRESSTKGQQVRFQALGRVDSVLPPGQDLHWYFDGASGGSNVHCHAA